MTDSPVDKKQVRREYKEAVQAAGAFRILNLTNGRCFVGVAPNLRARKNRFEMELRTGSLWNNPELLSDWQSLGEENFEFEVLEVLEQPDSPDYHPAEDLKALEELWLEKLEPWGDKGYNKPSKPRERAAGQS